VLSFISLSVMTTAYRIFLAVISYGPCSTAATHHTGSWPLSLFVQPTV